MRETTMRRLLPAHKIILLLSAFGLALALIVYVNGTGPNAAQHRKLSAQVKDLEEQLAAMRLPAGQDALAAMRQRAAARRQDIAGSLGKAMERYRSLYEPLIQKNSWTLDSFIRKAPLPPRNFYVNEFDRVIVHSPYGSLDTPDASVGLSRDVYSEDAHLQTLQLWCVDVLLGLAREQGLELVFAERKASAAPQPRRRQALAAAAAKTVRVAELVALPPEQTGWVGRGERRRPTMTRLAFRLSLRGGLAQHEAFVRALSRPGTFFGVGAFELLQEPPESGAGAEALRAGRQVLRLECLTFVPLPQPES